MTKQREWTITLYITTTYTRHVTTEADDIYRAESDAVDQATTDWGVGENSVESAGSWVSDHDATLEEPDEEGS